MQFDCISSIDVVDWVHSMKYFDHPLMAKFRALYLKPYFRAVFNSKPDASRSESSETYWICMGFTGARTFKSHKYKPVDIRATDEGEVPDDLELPPETCVGRIFDR